MPKLHDTWWDPILAIPPRKASASYRRLRHIWIDQTRVRPKVGHEYFVHEYETHITLALWETFAALPPRVWLPLLVERAGLCLPGPSVLEAAWSYGWVSDGSNEQIVDIVLNYRDTRGEGILVVEAKRPGERLAAKDLDPEYYLGIPTFQSFNRRSILYLVGHNEIAEARATVPSERHDVGFLTWPDLAAVQIETAIASFPDETVATLIANAIYRHFRDYEQAPPSPPVPYLQGEPTRDALTSTYMTSPQTNAQRMVPLWRLGRS